MAMIIMKPRHLASDLKSPDRSWPALVQNSADKEVDDG